MRHVKRSKLTLDSNTVRQLTAAQLNEAAGAGSQLQTCSMCPPGFYGCQTGNNC